MDSVTSKPEEKDEVFRRTSITNSNPYECSVDKPTVSDEYGSTDDEAECSRPSSIPEPQPVNVQQLGNEFRISFHVARYYHKLIRDEMKKNLELETRTRIHLPDSAAPTIPGATDDSDLVLTSIKREAVISAYRRISQLISKARLKAPLTHFLSMPMNNGAFKERLQEFKNQVLEVCGRGECYGVEEELFQKPQKLHFTICMLAILDDKEREEVIHTFQRCNELVIEPILRKQPLKVRIKGIECMRGNPLKTNVLYAKPDTDDPSTVVFQQLVNDINNYFLKAGLVARINDGKGVKLHMTVMNTKFVRKKVKFERKQRKPTTFDATKILEVFKEFEFGVVEINSIHVSELRIGKDGYYIPTFILNY